MVVSLAMAEFPSLIPALIELGLKSADTLHEVQARQVIYGGDQQLNLLELNLVTEEELLLALSTVCSLPAARPGPLVIDLPLTGELHLGGVIGVARWADDGSKIVVLDRVDDAVLARVSRLWTDGYQLQITTALRLKEATALFMGDKLPKRLTQVLDKLGPRSQRPNQGEQATQVSRLPDVAPIAGRDPIWALDLETKVIAPASFTREEITQLSPELEVKKTHEPVGAKTAALLKPNATQPIETAPPPTGYEDITAHSGAPSSRVGGGKLSLERKEYDLSDAILDLSTADSSDRIVEILVHFAASLFVYSAAFGVVGVEARGLRASGHGTHTEAIKGLTFPLDLASAFQRAQSHKDGDILRLRASGVEGGVARDLKRPVGMEVFLCPVIVQSRPVVLLWCDNNGATIPPESRQSFEQIMSHVARAFKRILVEKKRASRPPQPMDMLSVLPRPLAGKTPTTHDPAPLPPVVSTSIIPTPDSTIQSGPTLPTTSHPASEQPAKSAPAQSAPAASSSGDFPASSPTRIGLTDIVPRALFQTNLDHTQTQRNPAAPPQQGSIFPPPEERIPSSGEDDPRHEVASPKKRTLTRPGGSAKEGAARASDAPGSFPPEPPRTLKGFPPASAPKIEPAPVGTHLVVTSSSLAPRAPLLSRRIVALKKSPAGTDSPSERPNKVQDHAVEQLSQRPFIQATQTSITPPAPSYHPPQFEVASVEPEALRKTTPSDTLLSRRPLLPEPSESDWEPSQILPSAGSTGDSVVASELRRPISFSDLVAELLHGNHAVLPQLMDGGETAVGALIAEFPGPVSEPQSPSQKASECGPILAALVGLGGKSLPFVTVRTADENPRVRRWATFLLGELPGKESAHAIASRLLDSSIEVRRAALISARRVRRDTLTRRTLRAQVEQMCRDQSLDAEARCSAIEALADIREHEAIPVLLQLLQDFSSSVARSARWALSVLMRQDFGDDSDAWRQFWQEHRDEDRVEWLINSLDHDKRDIRRAAGDELRALCGKDFGYDEDQTQPERRRVQADFRTWWNETGKANLH